MAWLLIITPGQVHNHRLVYPYGVRLLQGNAMGFSPEDFTGRISIA